MREVRVADIDKRVSMALVTLRDGSPNRLAYLVVDTDAHVVASSDPRRVGALGPADLHWAAPHATDQLLGPVREPGQSTPRIVMTTPIPDPDDGRRVLGTLVGLFDWEHITAVTSAVRDELAADGVAADVLVCRPDGTVIGGAPSSRPDQPAAALGVTEAAAGPLGSTPDYIVHAAGGLIVGRALLDPDLPDFRLLVVEPLDHALAPALRLRRRLIATTGLALAAALGLAALAANRVVRPLSELTRAIRGLARGDAATRQVPVRSDDEVGVLATAFNQMASELDQAQRDLVEAGKFAFVGELAAGVAHEIRTSLGVLKSSTQILERSLPTETDAQVGELAWMIREEVGRLGNVVDDLLTLARGRPLRIEATPVSQPVFRAVDFVSAQAQAKGIRIERLGSVRAEPNVSCEPELIHQVAVNLLVNATQAVTHDGRISVRILDEEDGYGGFEIHDDGPGVPDELSERVFEPFVTGRPGGVGLGLTFVKRVVHDHRGRISLTSHPGSGTCVRVTLPVAEAGR